MQRAALTCIYILRREGTGYEAAIDGDGGATTNRLRLTTLYKFDAEQFGGPRLFRPSSSSLLVVQQRQQQRRQQQQQQQHAPSAFSLLRGDSVCSAFDVQTVRGCVCHKVTYARRVPAGSYANSPASQPASQPARQAGRQVPRRAQSAVQLRAHSLSPSVTPLCFCFDTHHRAGVATTSDGPNDEFCGLGRNNIRQTGCYTVHNDVWDDGRPHCPPVI